MKALLTITAILEAAVGAALLIAPSTPASVLLGSALNGPAPMTVARVGGAALFSLGVVSWFARLDAGSRAGRGIVADMLCYNCGAVGVLVYAIMGEGLHGIGLWPAVGLHAALALWCVAILSTRHPHHPSGSTPH